MGVLCNYREEEKQGKGEECVVSLLIVCDELVCLYDDLVSWCYMSWYVGVSPLHRPTDGAA